MPIHLSSLSLAVASALLLAACTSDCLCPAVDVPVLQISSSPGMISYPHAAAKVPLVTVWGDGRTVFVLPDERYKGNRALIRQANLGESTVRRLLTDADALYEMDDRYSAFIVTDAGTTTFSVRSANSRKTVSVYAFNPELDAAFRDREQHTEVMDRLRALYDAVIETLPEDAPPVRATEVSVIAKHRSSAREVEREWPEELVGHLTGEAAERAAALLAPGPIEVFLSEGVQHEITVMPVLPVLSEPNAIWPDGGIPLHPAATAYLLADSLPYRFDGVKQAEIATWYREAMQAQGWRLAKGAPDLQVWVQQREFGNDPILRFHFRPKHFTIELLEVYGDLPLHPDGTLEACGQQPCQVVHGASLEEVKGWFAEYLGYLGWDGGPELFRNDLGPNRGHDELLLDYEELIFNVEEDKRGVLVMPDKTFVQPSTWPPLPTPAPPEASR